MNKQEIIDALGFEPFEVFAARQRIKVLQMLLEYYDKGAYTLEQFKSLVSADRGTGKTTSTLLDAVEYIIEHPEITTLTIEYPKNYKILGEQACKDIEEYLNTLHALDKISKREVKLQAKPKNHYTTIGSQINSWKGTGYIKGNTLTIDLKL